MKKYNYYHVDCGHFPVQIKMCFSDSDFQNILRDHDIILKAKALDEGVAETHYLTDGKIGIIVLVFDLEECSDNPAELAGIIAHESSHCVNRVFEHIGEEVENIGDESRAYLTEHIVKQIHAGIAQHQEKEEKKNAGKRRRVLPNKEGQGDKRPVLQVVVDHNGGTGQVGNIQREDLPSGG
jgi:hypothetical protein